MTLRDGEVGLEPAGGELISMIDRRGLPEAGELQEAYREYCSDTDRTCVVSLGTGRPLAGR